MNKDSIKHTVFNIIKTFPSVNQHRNPVNQSFFSPMRTLGGNVDDTLSPVRKALRRAEARPKNLARSMEDITASLSPRELLS